MHFMRRNAVKRPIIGCAIFEIGLKQYNKRNKLFLNDSFKLQFTNLILTG